MGTFLYIFTNIIIPIFVLIAVGYVGQKKLKMEVRTFTKVNIYIFIPAILFTKIYQTDVTWQLFGTILMYMIAISVFMLFLGEGLARILKYPRGIRKAFVNSLLFFNSGNYGLPLVELAFHSNPIATTAQIFLMLIQNVMINTFGVFQASAGNDGNKQALKNILIMPSLYVVIIAVLVKAFHVIVPGFIMAPLESIAGGFVAMALITLGVQLAEVKFSFKLKDIFISCFIRLLISPAIGLLIVYLLGVEGVLAKALIIGAATPTAVNTAIIAKEFENEPEYASQMVFFSTVFSAITISGILFFMQYL